jgi:hypothetical protein
VPLDNEYFTMYNGEEEHKKVNLEEFKKHRDRQQAKQSAKRKTKATARAAAKRMGRKLGRWQGTYAVVKTGDDTGSYLHLNTLSICSERPGPVKND